jgi:hypothetical protein
LSAGQLKKGEIILALLLPSNQESARAIEPGMRAFHRPTACLIARDDLLLVFLFTSDTYVRLGVPCEQLLVDRSRVIGSV